MTPRRLKLIVLHGLGSSFSESIDRFLQFFSFKCAWHAGAFCVEKRDARLLRQLLQEPEGGRYACACQKLIVSRFLAASVNGERASLDLDAASRFPEDRLLETFTGFGIPLAPAARARRAAQLEQEAAATLSPLMESLGELAGALRAGEGAMLTEEGARSRIRHALSKVGGEDDLVELLERVRDLQETGGDLDSVASAVFYTHWTCADAVHAQHAPLLYGRDYRYVFVNYHESLVRLKEYGPADVLMADLPIGALPSFENDVRELREHDVHIERYEDHHPYTAEQDTMLRGLVTEGLIGTLSMSGPLRDEELDRDTARCGADMVHDNTIAGEPWDTPGAQTLKQAAHAEDLVAGHSELGRLLTSLIKGGVCKIELVQLLAASMENDDAIDRVRARRWHRRSEEWENHFKDVAFELLENTCMITFLRDTTTVAENGGESLGPGSDMPTPRPHKKNEREVNVLVSLAVHSKPGEPRIAVGQACAYLSREFPEADYLFYCYGASLVVTRRLNQADLTFNLGALMSKLGTPHDGGHAGAAVCRPEENAAYPRRLLGRVTASNFRAFSRYLAGRIEETGPRLIAIRDRSRPVESGQMKRGGKKLTIVTLAAIVIGILLALLHPKLRRSAIEESNRAFFPQLDPQTSQPEEGETR